MAVAVTWVHLTVVLGLWLDADDHGGSGAPALPVASAPADPIRFARLVDDSPRSPAEVAPIPSPPVALFVRTDRPIARPETPDAIAAADHDDPYTTRTLEMGPAADVAGEPSRPATPAVYRTPAAPNGGDLIDDLRESLGWGAIDRSTLADRPAGDGATGGASDVAASDAHKFDNVAFAAADGTPLAGWTEDVYAILTDRWKEHDLPVGERALGYQGDVTVAFRVDRAGRVSDVTVVRSSGHGALDRIAVEAIPSHLPRIPRAAPEPSVVQRITFAYRNNFP
jgi:TonB family protein